jgi:hypothetical protein
MVNQENVFSVIALTTPGIIELLMKNRGISQYDASKLLYNSALYRTLEDEETKVWRLSHPILYNLLEEELTTGKITWPEEQ